jgi:hypothetical protein
LSNRSDVINVYAQFNHYFFALVVNVTKPTIRYTTLYDFGKSRFFERLYLRGIFT